MPRRTFALILCYAAMMALATAVNLMPVFLVAVSRDFHGLSDEQGGRIAAVTFLGLVAAILASGPLVDRLPGYGAKAVAIGGNLLIALGLFLMAIAPSYGVLLAAGFVMGLGAGTLDMVLSPMVAVLRPLRRNVALNFLHAFYCIGAVLTILAASQCLAHGVSWRMATAYIVPFPLLVAAGFFFTGVPPLIGEGSVRTPLRVLCRDSFFLLAMAAIALGGATELGLAYWMPTYAQKNLHFSKVVADNGFLGFSLAMAVGRLGLGLIEHRIDTIALLMVCCVASAALFVAGAFAPPGWALAACILTGLSGSILWPSTLALASDRYPHGGATMFALLGALGNAGGIAMPWIMGIIADHSSLSLGIGSGAVCAALMIVALVPMGRLRLRPVGVRPSLPGGGRNPEF